MLKAAMTGLIRRIATRQIVPSSARAQDPEHSVEHGARVAPRSPTPIGPSPWSEQWIEHRPLGVGEVHALGLLCST
jgi:hypothetical protein